MVKAKDGERRAHMPNQFKRADKPDGQSVTVNLFCYGNDVRADVDGPVIQGGAIASQDIIGQEGNLDVPKALDIAVTLAERHNVKIVVHDRENLWKKEWGELI
jgi:hypothetical protein